MYRYGGCKSTIVACGFFGGFNAAVSQNLFGAGPGDGAGPACNTCYSLRSSTAGTKSIVVKINNLCPAVGNEAMCAQNGMSGTNSVGMCQHYPLWRLFTDLKTQELMLTSISAGTTARLLLSLEAQD